MEIMLAKELDSCRRSEKHDSFTEKKLQNPTSFTVEKVCALKFCPILMKNESHFVKSIICATVGRNFEILLLNKNM